MILNDYLQSGLNIVFCGTAAGDRSAERGHFYAGPGNKFWRTLHLIGLTPVLLEPEDDHRICEYRLGLTDLVKHHSGSDASLLPGMFDVAAFERKILAHTPRFVAFNGKKAAGVFLGLRNTALLPYGLHPQTIGRTRLFVLPSTSGAASGAWNETPWQDLAEHIRTSPR